MPQQSDADGARPADEPKDDEQGANPPDENSPKKEEGPPKKKGLRAPSAAADRRGRRLACSSPVGALLWWLHARNFESTDDAFIDTHIVRLAPQIAGPGHPGAGRRQPAGAGRPAPGRDRLRRRRDPRRPGPGPAGPGPGPGRQRPGPDQRQPGGLRAGPGRRRRRRRPRPTTPPRDLARYQTPAARSTPPAVAQQQFDQAARHGRARPPPSATPRAQGRRRPGRPDHGQPAPRSTSGQRAGAAPPRPSSNAAEHQPRLRPHRRARGRPRRAEDRGASATMCSPARS